MRDWLRKGARHSSSTPATTKPGPEPVIRVDIENDDEFMQHIEGCRPYTLTSLERLYGLNQAVRYIHQAGIVGDLVECGVWRGGSMALCARILRELGVADRTLWLFDTFEGMPPPSDEDVDLAGQAAADLLEGEQREHFQCMASLEEVRANLVRTGYPEGQMQFVEGEVEKTIPNWMPDQIALLRLDTDWYASTRHELEHLYPRLVDGGVMIIDDYGHWKGARQAVDEYFADQGLHPLLSRLDYSGRMMIKRMDT